MNQALHINDGWDEPEDDGHAQWDMPENPLDDFDPYLSRIEKEADHPFENMTEEEVYNGLHDKWWRLNHLYYIVDKFGRRVLFQPNEEQTRFYKNMWFMNIILKARQRGFTTLVDISFLDDAVFYENIEAGIIAHNREDVSKIFRRKILYPYENLPEMIKAGMPTITKSKTEIEFKNNSIISVGTSMRSGTLNRLHICLSGTTEIYLKNGEVKRIKDICSGDHVLTDKGSYQKVLCLIKNKSKELGQQLFSLNIFGYYSDLKITANHSILTREFKTGYPVWKQVKEISKNDYIALPIREPSMKLRDGMLPFNKPKYQYDKQGKRIKNKGLRVKADYDLGVLIGFYLAEGNVRRTETTFGIHRDETEWAVTLIEKFKDFFDSHRVYDSKTSLTTSVVINGKHFAEFIAKVFGSGINKNIPDAVWNYGSKFLRGLVWGYFKGDGSFKNINQIQITSIRRQLIDQMRLILISLRFGVPTIYHRKAGNYYERNCQEVWVLKLNGVGNWKFRQYFGLPLPDLTSWASRWNVEHNVNPNNLRKLWRRGKNHYWAQIKNVKKIQDEEFVYDLSLEASPHNYMTVNGIVHNSEFGKVCARFPEKAREIVTGAFEAIHTQTKEAVFTIESTAEGKGGYFYDYCKEAQDILKLGRKPTLMEFRFHFFPWWDNTENELQTPVPISESLAKYFQETESKIGQKFRPAQKYWYVMKWKILGEDMKRENPSTPEEAFEQAIKGAYFSTQFVKIREEKRICSVPHQPGATVRTWWDLGMNDVMAIWFSQDIGREIHMINYYENSGEGFDFYKREILDKTPYSFSNHNAPFDISVRELGTPGGADRWTSARKIGINFNKIPKTKSKIDSINAARRILSVCWFDEEKCAKGISRLENYRKEWNEHLESYKNTPLHDINSNGADAFQAMAMGHGWVVSMGAAIQIKKESSKGWT